MSVTPGIACPACGRAAASEQRFCGACGAALPASGETATNLAPAPALAPRGAAVAPPHAGFLPGVVLVNRYRIVGLLGRGGMGEVYRADDLRLGQPVALKFLPADVERDADRLERFLAEVRLSLRVTHPNVCRVFDVGQLEPAASSGPGPATGSGRATRHFLSMEYVDGEDLASLLRRIGRLPEDKAIEIARQLCAGLAAAHDEGVLHRDLKPANIMIDGRGRAKIADFGLASASGISGAEARAGTPQYMAPEQVAGRELSERTDLYAVGLVLYELFTGKRAFEIRNLDDLQRLQTSTPASPSSHVSGLNPLVERAILRCLEADPAKRPASAAALAASLPGGDPLAMAIAAGDTPSPEMVAAAGGEVRMSPRAAWTLVATVVAAALGGALLAQQTLLHRVGVLDRAPEVLRERSRDLLAGLGFPAPVDWIWGLAPNYRFLNAMAAGQVASPIDRFADSGITFWYRESPVAIEKIALLGPDGVARPSAYDPPIRYTDEVVVVFDRSGRLMSLAAMPPQLSDAATSGLAVDWTPLFRAAGLTPAEWVESAPEWTPQFHADLRLAWVPAAAAVPDGPVRVEAASFLGRPVSFTVVSPWTVPERQLATRRSRGEQIGNLIVVLLLCAVMLGSAIVARRNLARERGDTRGAVRVGAAVAVLAFFTWLADDKHVATIWELYLFTINAGFALFFGGVVAVFYLSLEPYVRRTWPHMIVSWSRAVAGTIRDPLVARDVLIGLAGAAVVHLLTGAGALLARELSGIPPRVLTEYRPLLGGTHVISAFLAAAMWAVFVAFFYLFLFFVLRRLLRRELLAGLAGAVLLSIGSTLEAGTMLAGVPFLVLNLLLFAVVSRVGLIATITIVWGLTILEGFPLTIPPSGWAAGTGLIGITVILSLAILCARAAMADGPSLRARPSS